MISLFPDRNRRQIIRFRISSHLFVDIKGHPCMPLARVVDLSRTGVGMITGETTGSTLPENIRVDIVTDEKILICSAIARVMYIERVEADHPDTRKNERRKICCRCGLKFMHVSTLQKMKFDKIIASYCHHPGNGTNPKRCRVNG